MHIMHLLVLSFAVFFSFALHFNCLFVCVCLYVYLYEFALKCYVKFLLQIVLSLFFWFCFFFFFNHWSMNEQRIMCLLLFVQLKVNEMKVNKLIACFALINFLMGSSHCGFVLLGCSLQSDFCRRMKCKLPDARRLPFHILYIYIYKCE